MFTVCLSCVDTEERQNVVTFSNGDSKCKQVGKWWILRIVLATQKGCHQRGTHVSLRTEHKWNSKWANELKAHVKCEDMKWYNYLKCCNIQTSVHFRHNWTWHRKDHLHRMLLLSNNVCQSWAWNEWIHI